MPDARLGKIAQAMHQVIVENAVELTELDQAIGDGDHGANMRRGLDALLELRDKLSELEFSEAVKLAGTTMVMTVGGAAGPLYGSFLLAVAKARTTTPKSLDEVAFAFHAGLDAIKARGKTNVGAKTLIDVFDPVLGALEEAGAGREPGDDMGLDTAAVIARVRRAADKGLASTRQMEAQVGRASYLGRRSLGHLDPGAKSACLLVHAICDVLEGRQTTEAVARNVSLVIVSQSAGVANGAVEIVQQMVGTAVRVAGCGGLQDGQLGTDVGAIMRAIEQVYSPRGVAVLVDLGGAETSAEMAIEMLPQHMGPNIRICDAPLVEGAVMAATEAASGSALSTVCNVAEDFRS